MKCFYDFHLHSCLSPCGDNDMTPYNLVNMAKILGYDIIALTDHNTALNCPAAVEVGKNIGITVVPGMELCTAEEIHTVCLFSEVKCALDFSDCVHSRMPPIKNRTEIFGEQLVTDAKDNVVATEELLLTNASDIGIDRVAEIVAEFGGIAYPAHIDRSSYSVISVLGTLYPELNFTAAELTPIADDGKYKEDYPILQKMKIMHSSDAHYLENMLEAKHFIELDECSAKAAVDFFKR